MLNNLENFQALPKSQNSSKGAKTVTKADSNQPGWQKYKEEDLHPTYKVSGK